ncbi:hypothetical protein OXIME_000951 [Oxyplasma meridianum]|uniref:Major facilitator superfamily (MFS) profile domain-containing protein n=1 Tax=Oxyplasma meridianum TaxID=3073602 RepID=A0AAX4NI09_9ARCH
MINVYTGFNAEVFSMVILALIALSLFVLGILTAYFGSGKSRSVGAGLLVVGVFIGFLTAYLSRYTFHLGLVQNVIYGTLFYVIAAIIGAVIGLLVFLGAIMKT